MPSDVWPGAEDPPFLPSRDDDACQGAPAWTAELRDGDLLRALRAFGLPRRSPARRADRVAQRDRAASRALTLDRAAAGRDLRRRISRVAVGRTLGWQHIKSTAFDLRRRAMSYRFSGHGSGHGVGMCVIGVGAARRAGQQRRRHPCDAIFPGWRSRPASDAGSDPGQTRSDPHGDPPKRRPYAAPVRRPGSQLSDLATRQRCSIASRRRRGRRAAHHDADAPRARRSGARARRHRAGRDAAVSLRPPTTTSASTGQAWFTSGAVVNNELHLLPLAVLRDRGVLDRTIRHELVHLMTDAALGERPAWVREGAAIYFAGEHAIPGEPAAAPGVQARAARLVPGRQRAAAAGVGRRAQQRLRARARVLRETDLARIGTRA